MWLNSLYESCIDEQIKTTHITHNLVNSVLSAEVHKRIPVYQMGIAPINRYQLNRILGI